MKRRLPVLPGGLELADSGKLTCSRGEFLQMGGVREAPAVRADERTGIEPGSAVFAVAAIGW